MVADGNGGDGDRDLRYAGGTTSGRMPGRWRCQEFSEPFDCRHIEPATVERLCQALTDGCLGSVTGGSERERPDAP